MTSYYKKHILKSICESHGFKGGPLHEANAFILGCVMYETKIPNVCLTDYDFYQQTDLEEKGIAIIFYRHKGFFCSQKASFELLEDDRMLNLVLENFMKFLKKHRDNTCERNFPA